MSEERVCTEDHLSIEKIDLKGREWNGSGMDGRCEDYLESFSI